MTPEEIIAREEARLGRRLNRDEKLAIHNGATSLTRIEEPFVIGGEDLPDVVAGEPVPPPVPEAATRAAERARRARAAADESNAVDRSSAFGDWLDRATGGHAESMLEGAIEGGTFGFGDELAGLARNPRGALSAVERLLGGTVDSPEEAAALAEYDARRDERRRAAEVAAEANPMLYGAGMLFGGMATAPLTPAIGAGGAVTGGVTRGASAVLPRAATALRAAAPRLGAAVATGGAYGALGGAGASEATSAPEVVSDAASGAGTGALMGGGLGVAAEALPAAARAAPAVRDLADRALLSIPGGSGAALDNLRRMIGGTTREAAEAVRRSGLVPPGSSPAGIARAARAEIEDANPTALERILAAHPEGSVDPMELARTIRSVIEENPNPSERAAMSELASIASDLESLGGTRSVPVEGPVQFPPAADLRGADLLPSDIRPSPAPEEMAGSLPAELPRAAFEEMPDFMPPAEPPPAPPPPGPNRRRFVNAVTEPPDADPGYRDTVRMPHWYEESDDAIAAGLDHPPTPIAPFISPDAPLALGEWRPSPPPPDPLTRPRGERPLGAREMSGEWRGGGAPPLGTGTITSTIPYSGTTSRPPGTAMHADRRLRGASEYGAARPDYVAEAARTARSRVQDLLDRHAERIVGPEELAAHRAARERAHVAMAIRDSADPAASREAAAFVRTPRSERFTRAALGAMTGGAAGSTHGTPAMLGGAALGAFAPDVASVVGDRLPSLYAHGLHRAASGLESPGLASAVAGLDRSVPLATRAVAPSLGAAAAADVESPDERRARIEALPRRRAAAPDSATIEPDDARRARIEALPRRRRTP